MEQSTKRKYAPSGSDRHSGAMKRSRGGNQGKWQMPRQKAMQLQRGSIEPGDMGIWVTCARNQEGKAAREAQLLFDEYAEVMYGVQQPGEGADSDADEPEDIEASIQKELGSMGSRKTQRPFSPVRVNVECLLFYKVRAPVEPVHFVHRICKDAAVAGSSTGSDKSQALSRSTRYVDRMTPISRVGRATEQGIELLARIVLAPFFDMKPASEAEKKTGEEEKAQDQLDGETSEQLPAKTAEQSSTGTGDQDQTIAEDQAKLKADKPAYSYAIRPSLRNNKQVKRDMVIKQIANLIKDEHKVNLGAPDKVILVDIYQTVCGMSVVDGDWDTLKRYNLNELYHPTEKPDQKATIDYEKPAAPVEASSEAAPTS